MTDLETSMATLIAVFQKYSEREGDKHKLKKSELKDLLHDELPDLMAVSSKLSTSRWNWPQLLFLLYLILHHSFPPAAREGPVHSGQPDGGPGHRRRLRVQLPGIHDLRLHGDRLLPRVL